jgi:hypothetical protein
VRPVNASDFNRLRTNAILRAIVQAPSVRQAVNTAASAMGDYLDLFMISFGHEACCADFYESFCRDRSEDFALFSDPASRMDRYFWCAAAQIFRTSAGLPNLNDAQTYAALLGSSVNWGQSSEIAGREAEFLSAVICSSLLFVQSKAAAALGGTSAWEDIGFDLSNSHFESETEDLGD